MKHLLRTAGVLLAAPGLVVVVGPFLVPIPPLEGTAPSEDLADAAGQFTPLNRVRVRIPALVVTGDDACIVPARESTRLAQAIPGAESAIIPACAHVLHEECPQAFLRSVEDLMTDSHVGPAFQRQPTGESD